MFDPLLPPSDFMLKQTMKLAVHLVSDSHTSTSKMHASALSRCTADKLTCEPPAGKQLPQAGGQTPAAVAAAACISITPLVLDSTAGSTADAIPPCIDTPHL